MIRLKYIADLTRNYIISSRRLRVVHWLILGLTVCTLFTIIVNIRAPAFLQIPLILLSGFVILNCQIKLDFSSNSEKLGMVFDNLGN